MIEKFSMFFAMGLLGFALGNLTHASGVYGIGLFPEIHSLILNTHDSECGDGYVICAKSNGDELRQYSDMKAILCHSFNWRDALECRP